MRLFKGIVILFLVILLGWGIYSLVEEHASLDSEVNDLRAQAEDIKKENISISEKIDFFKNPDNLVKELKSQTNVVGPGERLIIIVPPKATTSSENEE